LDASLIFSLHSNIVFSVEWHTLGKSSVYFLLQLLSQHGTSVVYGSSFHGGFPPRGTRYGILAQ
jgi:hypothetical protein